MFFSTTKDRFGPQNGIPSPGPGSYETNRSPPKVKGAVKMVDNWLVSPSTATAMGQSGRGSSLSPRREGRLNVECSDSPGVGTYNISHDFIRKSYHKGNTWTKSKTLSRKLAEAPGPGPGQYFNEADASSMKTHTYNKVMPHFAGLHASQKKKGDDDIEEVITKGHIETSSSSHNTSRAGNRNEMKEVFSLLKSMTSENG